MSGKQGYREPGKRPAATAAGCLQRGCRLLTLVKEALA